MRSQLKKDRIALDSGVHAHIAQFIDSMDPGGAEQIVLDLSERLVNRGFRVTLFHFGNPWLLERATDLRLDQVILEDRANYKSKYRLPLFLWRLKRSLNARGVDLIHSHLLGAALAGSLTAKLAHIPSVVTLHDTYTLSGGTNARGILSLIRKTGTTVVSISDEMSRMLSDDFQLAPKQRCTIVNGVNVARFAARRAPLATDNTVVLTTIARFVEVKRLDVLLHAAKLIETTAPWRLQLIGDGPLRKDLESLCNELSITDRVQFLGFRDEIPQLLNSSDVFVLSSDSEGLSVSIMESMAAGLPTVATNVGGNGDLVDDEVSGFLVPRGDSAALAQKLTTLIENEEIRRKFGAAAKSRAENLYDLDTMTTQYIRLYDGLMG